MAILKLNTAYSRTFFLVQSADHITGLTGAVASCVVSLSKNTGAFAGNNGGNSAIHEIASGWYWVLLNPTDLNTAGDLAYHITATGADPTDFSDQVQSQLVTDIALDASGNVSIASSLKKNQASIIGFTMTIGNPPVPGTGLTVSCQRAFPPAGFAPCATPTATEMSNGDYYVPLAATDTNAGFIMFRFTAPGANDQNIVVWTQP